MKFTEQQRNDLSYIVSLAKKNVNQADDNRFSVDIVKALLSFDETGTFEYLKTMKPQNNVNVFVAFYVFIDNFVMSSKIALPVNIVSPFHPSHKIITQFISQFTDFMQHLMQINTQEVNHLLIFIIKKLKDRWAYNVLFDTAVRCGNQAAIEYFLHHALATAEDCLGDNALSIAMEKHNLTLANYLVKKFPTLLNKQNNEGRSPLHYAAMHNFHDGLWLLIRHGVIFNQIDSHGNMAEALVPPPAHNPHHMANPGNDVVRRTLERIHAIFVCIIQGAKMVIHPSSNNEVIDYFYAKDTSGHSAAHLAVLHADKSNNIDLLKMMIHHKIDLSITNDDHINLWTLIEHSQHLPDDVVVSAGILKIKQVIQNREATVNLSDKQLDKDLKIARNEVMHILKVITPRFVSLNTGPFSLASQYAIELGTILGLPHSNFFMPKQVYDLYLDNLSDPLDSEHLSNFQKGHLSLSEFFMGGFLKLKTQGLGLEETSVVELGHGLMEEDQGAFFDSKEDKEKHETTRIEQDTKEALDEVLENDKARDLRQLATLHHAILAGQYNQANVAKIMAEFCLGKTHSMSGFKDAITQYTPGIAHQGNVMTNVLCHLKNATHKIERLQHENDTKVLEVKNLAEQNKVQEKEIFSLKAKIQQSEAQFSQKNLSQQISKEVQQDSGPKPMDESDDKADVFDKAEDARVARNDSSVYSNHSILPSSLSPQSRSPLPSSLTPSPSRLPSLSYSSSSFSALQFQHHKKEDKKRKYSDEPVLESDNMVNNSNYSNNSSNNRGNHSNAQGTESARVETPSSMPSKKKAKLVK